MEPVCWAGIVGIIAIGAVIGGFFKGSCKNSSCGCGAKEDSTKVKESSASGTGVDEKKEKAINDLIK